MEQYCDVASTEPHRPRSFSRTEVRQVPERDYIVIPLWQIPERPQDLLAVDHVFDHRGRIQFRNKDATVGWNLSARDSQVLTLPTPRSRTHQARHLIGGDAEHPWAKPVPIAGTELVERSPCLLESHCGDVVSDVSRPGATLSECVHSSGMTTKERAERGLITLQATRNERTVTQSARIRISGR